MDSLINTLFSIIQSVVNMLDSVAFSAFGATVSYLDCIIGFIALAFIISVFWKGARA